MVLVAKGLSWWRNGARFENPKLGPTAVWVPSSDQPDGTLEPYPGSTAAVPLVAESQDDCVVYFEGGLYQFNLTGTSFINKCLVPIEPHRRYLDAESFGVWNRGGPELCVRHKCPLLWQ